MSYQYKTKLFYEELKEVYAKYISIKSGGFLDDSSYEFSKEVNHLYEKLIEKKWDISQVSDDFFKQVLSFDVITGKYNFENIPPAPRCYDSISFQELVIEKENSKSIFNIFSSSEKYDEENYDKKNTCNTLTFFAVAAVGVALSMSM